MHHFDWISGFVYPYFNFFFFLVLLVYFAKKPVRMLFKKRREDFQKLYYSAKEAKQESEKKLEEQLRRYKSLEQEIVDLKNQLLKVAEQEAQEIIKDAKVAAGYLKQEAEKISSIELAKAENIIKKQVWSSAKQVVIDRIAMDLKDPKKQADLFD